MTKETPAEDIARMFTAMNESISKAFGAFNETQHPRATAGSMGGYRGGEFTPKGEGEGGEAGGDAGASQVPVQPIFRWFRGVDHADLWGRKMYAQWAQTLNLDDREAIRFYMDEGHSIINGALRAQQGPKYLESRIQILDSVLDRSMVPENVVLWRSFRSEELTENWGKLLGSTFSDPGFVSATLDPATAFKSSGNDKHSYLAQIRLPALLPGVYLDAIRPVGTGEMLLPRGMSFTVSGMDDAGKVKHLVLDVAGLAQ